MLKYLELESFNCNCKYLDMQSSFNATICLYKCF